MSTQKLSPWSGPQERNHDEITPIISAQHGPDRDYMTGTAPSSSSSKPKQTESKPGGKDAMPPTAPEGRSIAESSSPERGFWGRLIDKYGAAELDNKGSVARDHLALERTFLAWLRTSLSFASIGIAITQLFRLNTSVVEDIDPMLARRAAANADQLRQMGKPLGATFLGISILVLLIGWRRYFESQHWIINGKFPASRGSIIVVTFVAATLIIASLVVVLSVGENRFEKRDL